nr:protein EARLY FLOWERING 4-like [Quercus suber]POE51089.1 protein early flowering 4 [Quercus suber]
MTTPDYCSSTATTTTDSTMSNPSSNHHHHHQNLTKTAAEERGDAEVWNSLNHNFRQVQTVLDRNRVLIQQVNENHQSRIPDNMVKNVALIQEINGNISKVVSLYSNLSSDFSSKFHERTNKSDGSDKSESPPGPEWDHLLTRSIHQPYECN